MDLSGFKEKEFLLFEKIISTYLSKLYLASAVAYSNCEIAIKEVSLTNNHNCNILIKNACLVNIGQNVAILVDSIKDNAEFITEEIEKKLNKFQLASDDWVHSEELQKCVAFASTHSKIAGDILSINGCRGPSSDFPAAFTYLNTSDASANCALNLIARALGDTQDEPKNDVSKTDALYLSIIYHIIIAFSCFVFLFGIIVLIYKPTSLHAFYFKTNHHVESKTH